MFDIGTDASPDEIAETVIETDSDYVAISTYNGIALTFAKRVLAEMEKAGITVPVFMGGVLNETMDGEKLPIDVTDKLKELGILCSGAAERIVDMILEGCGKENR